MSAPGADWQGFKNGLRVVQRMGSFTGRCNNYVTIAHTDFQIEGHCCVGLHWEAPATSAPPFTFVQSYSYVVVVEVCIDAGTAMRCSVSLPSLVHRK